MTFRINCPVDVGAFRLCGSTAPYLIFRDVSVPERSSTAIASLTICVYCYSLMLINMIPGIAPCLKPAGPVLTVATGADAARRT